MTIRVVLADDEPLVRAGIAMLLAAEPDIEVVAEVGDGKAAVEAVRCTHPDVVVMDVRMPGMDGVEATRLIAGSLPDRQPHGSPVSVLVLTTFNVDEAVFSALRAGASGFLLKDAAPGELVDAIRSVATGQGWLDPAVTRALIREFAACEQVDPRAANVSRPLGELNSTASLVPHVIARAQGDGDTRQRPAVSKAVSKPVSRAIFKKEGEYWTISYEGSLFRLKDSTGLRYLSRLLREPGREFHALDLIRPEGGSPQRSDPRPDEPFEQPRSQLGLGHAGELLDEQAKAAYRRRMAELHEELDEAGAWADPERVSRLRQEIEMLSQELARGVGLGGRDRVAGAASERARINVTKAIRSAVRRIGTCDPSLGRHLGLFVRTGTFCSYGPDTRAVVWHF